MSTSPTAPPPGEPRRRARAGRGPARRRGTAVLAGLACAAALGTAPAGADTWPTAPEPPVAPQRPGTAPEPPWSTGGTQGGSGSSHAQSLVSEVNAAHTGAGCARLREDDRLTDAARKHAADMGRRDRLTHASANGDRGDDRAEAEGYRHWSGELIARGQSTAAEAVRDWRNSSSHRRIMLDCGHTEIGAGAYDASGRIYWTVVLGRG
ncbi:CAP domain-containing protein [Streptomonospora sp. S1-112]|uniref:CAP domain-containing protein n=1 Tax=Streptomonospora mangrovi TaxID=2883123 RepID=A0A9X3NPP9_9ACTN|nr:CAP domain-containing protein [Streptomonospora mangrovi]MDA0567604.1 CAP domain-containing protein [Streptomonospora mangrovi]